MKFFLKILFILSLLPLSAAGQDSLFVPAEDEMIEQIENQEFDADEEALVEPSGNPPRAASEAKLRNISSEQWQKATGSLDYSKDLPAEKKEEPKPMDLPKGPDFNFEALAKFFQVLAIIIALAGIGFAIYRMMEEPRNRQIASDGAEITLENVEDYLHESDLDRFLREALAASNYPLAVRLYYLQIIRGLSERKAIEWSREKTNRDYLREMRRHRLFAEFQEATRAYERVWYGASPLDETAFSKLEPNFKSLAHSAAI